ncbi:MAG: nuclear transport factor 2 family protein [Solirubrobacteraceae bacterium]
MRLLHPFASAPRVRAPRLPRRRLGGCGAAFGAALALAACGTTTGSTSSFSGPAKGVAEAISSFQSDATALNAAKICKEELAGSVVSRLSKNGAKCEKSIKTALEETDTFTVSVKSIAVKGSSAVAKVKSTVYGKERAGTMSLVREGGKWKVANLG